MHDRGHSCLEKERTNSIGFNALRDTRWEGVNRSGGTMQKSTPAETVFPEGGGSSKRTMPQQCTILSFSMPRVALRVSTTNCDS